MSRLTELRSILQHIVLASLPLAAGCTAIDDLVDDDPCSDTFNRTFELDSFQDDGPLRLRVESCRMDAAACQELCQFVMQRASISNYPEQCTVEFSGEASATVDVVYTVQTNANGCAVEGRRPAGLCSPVGGDARSAAGAWLAHAAWLEAASIYAFVHLAQELERFGAPTSLVRRSIASANDEIRHATTMIQLARRYGATPPPVTVDPVGERSLVELAVENMAEGCVRETWGAVLAMFQARTALDPVVRAAYAVIARDELRHAALAWDIDRWIAPQLSDEQRALVAATRERVARELLDSSDPSIAIAALGLPSSTDARALLAHTYDSLWTHSGGRS